MNFLNDLTVFCLGVGLPLGGLVLGRRIGPVSACWAAAGLFLALRFADRLWRAVFLDLRAADPSIDAAFWLGASFALLFLGLLALVVLWLLAVRPAPREYALPGPSAEVVAMVAGGVGGLLLVLAIIQSQSMRPDADTRLSRSLGIARPILTALGQTRVAPAPAVPESPRP